MQLKPISQQVVVVMGASSGIGRLAALDFARRGARVVVSARSEDGLQSLVEEIREAGGDAIWVPADVADYAQVQRVAERAVETYGRFDTWVHAAGVAMWARLEDMRPEEFRRVIDVNLTGAAHGAMVALPHLRQSQGALIMISSIEARIPVPLQTAYGASKHGMDAFCKALRLELQADQAPVSLTEILPSSINTPLFSRSRARIGARPRPIPPVYDPQLVSDAILYAAENSVDEITVGGGGRLFLYGQRFAPRLNEAVTLMLGERLQRSTRDEFPNAQDNLFEPRDQDNRIRGDFGSETRSTSVYTWLKQHRTAEKALLGAAVGVAAVLAGRALRGGRGPASG